jgi:hypothetical protein
METFNFLHEDIRLAVLMRLIIIGPAMKFSMPPAAETT